MAQAQRQQDEHRRASIRSFLIIGFEWDPKDRGEFPNLHKFDVFNSDVAQQELVRLFGEGLQYSPTL